MLSLHLSCSGFDVSTLCVKCGDGINLSPGEVKDLVVGVVILFSYLVKHGKLAIFIHSVTSYQLPVVTKQVIRTGDGV